MGKESILKAYLSAYVFADGKYYVAYCPELDISAAGEDESDARQALTEVLGIYFEDTISRGTLEEDLQRHGWRKRGSTVATPSPSTLLRRSTLRNILCKDEFHKYAIPMATLWTLINSPISPLMTFVSFFSTKDVAARKHIPAQKVVADTKNGTGQTSCALSSCRHT